MSELAKLLRNIEYERDVDWQRQTDGQNAVINDTLNCIIRAIKETIEEEKSAPPPDVRTYFQNEQLAVRLIVKEKGREWTKVVGGNDPIGVWIPTSWLKKE